MEQGCQVRKKLSIIMEQAQVRSKFLDVLGLRCLPKPDDLFTALSGGQHSTKIDLTHAYQQMSLEESFRELVTVNTHRGLYCYTQLPFGVASAPANWLQFDLSLVKIKGSSTLFADQKNLDAGCKHFNWLHILI